MLLLLLLILASIPAPGDDVGWKYTEISFKTQWTKLYTGRGIQNKLMNSREIWLVQPFPVELLLPKTYTGNQDEAIV